jgi:MYXO-CTERM domain-containing protein
MSARRWLVGPLLLASLLLATNAQAFSVRVHLYLANAIHDELKRSVDAGGEPSVRLMLPDGMEPMRVRLGELDARAILQQLEFFRGGAIGPDNTVMTGLTDPSHAWMFQPFRQCEALVFEAELGEQAQRDSGLSDDQLDLSERAYALGCFLHGISDNAAHHLVNYLTGETFTFYPKESAGAGLEWSMLNIARHIVVETNFEKSLEAEDAALTDRTRPGVSSAAITPDAFTHRIPKDLVRRVYFSRTNTNWSGLWSEFAGELAETKSLQLKTVLGLPPSGDIVETLLASPDAWDDDKSVVNAYVAFLGAEISAPADYILFIPELIADIKTFYQIVNEQGRAIALDPPAFPLTYGSMMENAFAPRNGFGDIAWNGTEPSNFEVVMAEKFAEMDNLGNAYLQTVENVSNLNVTVGLVHLTPEQRVEALEPLVTAINNITTVNYQILFTDGVAQAIDAVLNLTEVLDGLFNIITEKVKEHITERIRTYLEVFQLDYSFLADAAKAHVQTLEEEAVASLGLNLESGVFDTYLSSVLYMNGYNSVVGVLGSHSVVTPNQSGMFGGPVSFDASYQLEYNQLALCPELRSTFYPCGISAGTMMQGDYRTCQVLADDINPAIECHDQSAVAFASMPSPASCAPTLLDAFLTGGPVSGSYTLAYPPSSNHFDAAQPACWIADLTVEVDDGPIGGGGSGGTSGNDADESDSSGGCGCRLAGAPSAPSDRAPSNHTAWLMLLAGAAVVTRRRRAH